MSTLRQIFTRHPRLVSALALASVVTLFFAFRFIFGVIYWSQHAEEPIRAWMTVGYVGKSWDIPPRKIDDIAGLPKPIDGKPFTLQEIADQRGVSVDVIIKKVEEAITTLRARKGG